MKKYNIVMFIIGLFILLPIRTSADTNFGLVTKRFEIINQKMYSAFSGIDYFGQDRSHYYVKYLKTGSKVRVAYCTNYTSEFIDDTDYSSRGAADIGIQYIIKNGFTGASDDGQTYHYSTNSDCTANECPSLVKLKTNYPKSNSPWYVNYWLTQMAIWIYLDQVDNFTGSNLSDYEKTIKNLVAKAKTVSKSTTNFANVNPEMSIDDNTMSLDGDYYYSKLITATGVGSTFTVSVNDEDYEVVDSDKNAKTTFNSGDKFYVRVLKNKLTSSEQVTVTLETRGATYANSYTSSGSQRLAAYVLTEKAPVTTTLELNVEYVCNLTISVVDSVTKEKVCGGTFTIYDENGNLAKDINGNEIGTIELSPDNCQKTVYLPNGKCQVVQQTSIEPYIKDDKVYDIITESACLSNVEFNNEKLYQIKILKVGDSENNPIQDAKLRLTDSNGSVIKEFTSTTEPIVIDKLHAGTYYLSEVKAPSGYALSKEKMTIEVNNENNDKLFTFKNDEIVVPKTDFNSNIFVFGLLLGAVGIGIIYYSKKVYV